MSGKDFYFMGISEIIGNKRDEVLALAARYGASNVRIFGSVAHGTADTDSDIDFLVDMEKGRSLLDLGGLLMDLQKLLGSNVDVITPAGLRSRIRASVLDRAVKL
jgi:predicted nucleotidyltransferase